MKLFHADAQASEFVFIGMDEAGYGPNLGPLVLSVTRWKTPQPAAKVDFYELLKNSVDAKSHQKHTRLHIADSKNVYSGTKGLASLEASALAMLHCLNVPCGTFSDLWKGLTSEPFPDHIPWFQNTDLTLPVAIPKDTLDTLSAQLQESMSDAQLELTQVRSQIITAERFNQLVERDGSKGITLSRLAFALLREVWKPNDETFTLFVGDKHGGRNRYDELLSEVLDGEMIFRVEESRVISTYRVGQSELRFQTKGEQHFPVAVASIISKYIRELSMDLFNNYWQQHCPDVKPTKGYPQDALRFQADVAEKRAELDIKDAIFWRCR